MKKEKTLRVPVTNGLKNIYAMDMHLAFQAATIGKFNVNAFARLASALAVVRTALEQNKTQFTDALESMDKAILILVEVRRRGDETDVWEIPESEQSTVLDGILMAEESIGTLDVALLENTAAQLMNSFQGA